MEDRVCTRHMPPIVRNALQFLYVGKPPVVAVCKSQLRTVCKGLLPRIRLRCHFLLPHEPSAVVRHGAVKIVDKAVFPLTTR